MFSVAPESFGAAVRELRDAFGPRPAVERLGPDLGVLGDGPTVDGIGSPVFIRHLTVERARLRAPGPDAVAAAAREVLDAERIGPEIAVQTWLSGPGHDHKTTAAELYHHLAATLGRDVARANREWVLSCDLTAGGVSIGLNRAAASLCDWPGGRVRLARDPAQVSRSEFKLEELFQVNPVDLPERGRAVDLGASPGGWTRILRRAGLSVWAVDPGELDPRVAADPRVHHARTTAAEFLRADRTSFDAVVNDLRMEPSLSCTLMLDAAAHLRLGAPAIVTLKTGSRQPVDTVRRCLDLLGRRYRIAFARQLHHNRNEVTVVAYRSGA